MMQAQHHDAARHVTCTLAGNQLDRVLLDSLINWTAASHSNARGRQDYQRLLKIDGELSWSEGECPYEPVFAREELDENSITITLDPMHCPNRRTLEHTVVALTETTRNQHAREVFEDYLAATEPLTLDEITA